MIYEYEKKFSENLRKIRKERGFTQERLAAKLQINNCDLSRGTIAKIESGKRHIYPHEIKLIKEILNVTYEEIFDINK